MGEVTNRFKGLYLIYRVPEELWTEFTKLYRRWRSKPSTRRRNVGRQNNCLRRHCKYLRIERSKRPRRKGKIYPSQCRVPKNGKERYESLLGEKGKVIKGKNRIGNTRDLFKKIRDTKGTFHANGHNKGQKEYGPNRSRRY